MPGAGITPKTAKSVFETTQCKEMHVHFTKSYEDLSTMNNRNIYYGSALYPSETHYSVIDADKIKSLND